MPRRYARSIATDDDHIGLLKTLAPETLATLHDNLRSTIIPAPAQSTAGGRALEVLARLAGGDQSGLEHGDIIGEGGMGVIRTAKQVALGRSVAVKTLKPDRRGKAAAIDLLREAWVTGSLEHPNVVPVHYLEIDSEGVPVIVMKKITGVEWSKLLADAGEVERRFGATDLLSWNLGILMSVLNALRYAHSCGVIHRDLKPSNVMIGDFGEVYLLDWGIAVSLRDDGSGRLPLAVNATQLAGTPHYMAPEMLGRADGPPITERTDVYLVGSVLYELMTGRPPHEGASVGAVLASVVASSPVIPASAPPELAAICLRAMSAAPEQRFASADELRVAIQQYLEHRGSADLAARASVRLDELAAVLARPDPDPDTIYRLFGACRFGFHEALSVWPANRGARDGLARAIASVAEYELGAGNPKGAVSLLGELDEPPAGLLAKARGEIEAEARRHAEHEKLRKDLDPTAGRRTRTFFAVLLGLAFTALPLVNETVGSMRAQQSHARDTGLAAITLVLLLGMAYWARNSMRATAFNRKIALTGLFVFVGQIVLSLGAWSLGLTPAESQVIMMFYWGVITTMLTITVDVWLWPASLLYFVWFSVAAAYPEARYFTMAAGNLCFSINAFVRWSPATFIPTDEERAERRARDRAARRR